MSPTGVSPSTLAQVEAAFNAHDLDGLVACFDPDYHSEQPAHPDRTFDGREQARRNWAALFADIPDFQARRLREAEADGAVWTEWEWAGTTTGGSAFLMRGVTLFGIRAGRLAWGRLYMEPVEQAGAGIEAAVRKLGQGSEGGS